MSNPKRKELRLVEPVDRWKIDGNNLDDIIAYLSDLRDRTDGQGRLDFDVEDNWGSYSVNMELWWSRMQTDEEYEAACKEHHKRAAAARRAAATKKREAEKEERALLEKLKAKYES